MPFSPHDAATHALARAQAMLDVSEPEGAMDAETAEDIWRMSLVMAVAALDTYMHRLVVGRAYSHDQLPGKLARLEFPFEQLLQEADDSAAAARAAPHNSRPRVRIKRQLRDRLLRETFQSYDDVSTALGMAGLSGNWQAIGGQMNPAATGPQIKLRLNAIVRRRNQIVHEGDYLRLDRPQQATRNTIDHAQTVDDVAWIGTLVHAIDAVA